MHHSVGRVLVSTFMVLGASCDGQTPDTVAQTARISQVVQFADTQPFVAPVAQGSTLLFAVQSVDGHALSTDVSLTVSATTSGQFATIVPIGVAQYAVTLGSVGAYNLQAMDGIDAIAITTLTAAPMRDLAVASTLSVTTTGTDATGQSCSSTETVGSLRGLLLHANQTLMFSVVPLGGDGAPMMGTLSLLASGEHVRVDSPSIGSGTRGNTLTATPLIGAVGPASVRVADQATSISVLVEFAVADDLADAHCP